jgi:phosphomannomutase
LFELSVYYSISKSLLGQAITIKIKLSIKGKIWYDKSMEIDPTIFKTYDIRGVYPKQINQKVAYIIGRSFCFYLKTYNRILKPKIAVGLDVRVSSPLLAKGLITGLKDGGAEVLNIGLCSTPLNYFANWFLGLDASIMITASHNPKEYNGFKISLKKVRSLSEEDGMKKLKEISLEGKFGKKLKGTVKKINILDDYLNFLEKEAQDCDFSKIKIIADCGNGMVGPIFEKLAERINLNYYGLFFEPDGNFPNHEPNPLKEEALSHIKKTIKKKKAHLGVIFDGDGDRFVVLDKNGNALRGDFILGLFAKHYIEEKRAKFIPSDLRISRGVKEEIEKVGGVIVKCRVGYPHIRRTMRRYNAFIGGELSGHFFWRDFSYSESALFSMIRLLKILSEEDKPIDSLIKPMKKYFTTAEINFEVEKKAEKIKELEKIFSDGDIIKLDGLTVEYKNWWFNIRPSNTEPVLRLTIEANSKQLLDRKIKELTRLIG